MKYKNFIKSVSPSRQARHRCGLARASTITKEFCARFTDLVPARIRFPYTVREVDTQNAINLPTSSHTIKESRSPACLCP